MRLLLTGGMVYQNSSFHRLDVSLDSGLIVCVSPLIPQTGFDRVVDMRNQYLVPGFVDVHVHLREPGFSYKETIRTGTEAAARGGYTAVCAMPNLHPAPDCRAALDMQRAIIARDAAVRVTPYGCITVGEKGSELVDFETLAPDVCAFTDDGKGVQDRGLMREAMLLARAAGRLIAAHCEDEALLGGGHVHDGALAKRLGIRGVSSESEWRQVERDLELVAETGCRYHVCHISTKESAALIRQAKRDGLPVTCETGPHYLALTDTELRDEGRFKMNPPVRTSADRDALREALADGTIDMIATDHAPHAEHEKDKGLLGSAMGIVGLETAFPVLYTALVEPGFLTLEALVERMCLAPRRVFGLPGGEIAAGQPADLTALELGREYAIDSRTFRSMGKATPFDGWRVRGNIAMTICEGRIVWDRNTQEN